MYKVNKIYKKSEKNNLPVKEKYIFTQVPHILFICTQC